MKAVSLSIWALRIFSRMSEPVWRNRLSSWAMKSGRQSMVGSTPIFKAARSSRSWLIYWARVRVRRVWRDSPQAQARSRETKGIMRGKDRFVILMIH